jgi:hypothetical protein
MQRKLATTFAASGGSALLAFMFGATGAIAFGILPAGADGARWADSTVQIELHESGTSDVSDGSDLEAVRRALASWNQVDCSKLELVESGTTTATGNLVVGGGTDGINRVLWVEDGSFPGGPGTLGLTLVNYDSASGVINEADIVFNGYNTNRPWSTAGDGNGIDVESIAVHELGHLIGLRHVFDGHNLSDPPTMSARPDGSTVYRSLHADDMAGACFLYPRDSYACATDCDCPTLKPNDVNAFEYGGGQMVCNDGTCAMSSTTDLPLGAECGAGSTCASGLFCQPTEAASFCSQSCTPNTANACPGGLTCFDFGGPGACLPGNWEDTSICLADVGAKIENPEDQEGDCQGDDCPGSGEDEAPGGCSAVLGSPGGNGTMASALFALLLATNWRRRRKG